MEQIGYKKLQSAVQMSFSVRPMPMDRCLSCPVCPVCLSVTLVYCGQRVGWIKMKLGTEVGLGPGNILLHSDPVPHSKTGHSSQFSTHVCCGQTAGWVMPLGMMVGRGPGDIVLDGDPAPPKWGHSSPHFSAHVLWSYGWMNQDATWYGSRPRPRPCCVR